MHVHLLFLWRWCRRSQARQHMLLTEWCFWPAYVPSLRLAWSADAAAHRPAARHRVQKRRAQGGVKGRTAALGP